MWVPGSNYSPWGLGQEHLPTGSSPWLCLYLFKAWLTAVHLHKVLFILYSSMNFVKYLHCAQYTENFSSKTHISALVSKVVLYYLSLPWFPLGNLHWFIGMWFQPCQFRQAASSKHLNTVLRTLLQAHSCYRRFCHAEARCQLYFNSMYGHMCSLSLY